MNRTFEAYRRMSLEIGYLVFRNIFILINVIIFTVVGLLIAFGDTREGLFLGIVISANIIMGIIQDVNAWVVLERLQLLTAPKARRVVDGGAEAVVSPEELKEGEKIRLVLGDQVPCDSAVMEESSFEVSESIITGESNSISKTEGEKLLAGSIVTAGTATARVEKVFRESRIAKMTARIKRYTINESPTQEEINKVVVYSGYVLLAVIAFVVLRGMIAHEAEVSIVRTIGALSSILVPQGLIVATTLLFAYGGIHFYRRHVLLREVNATEKLAHIKHLCMDKTGTLTTNELVVEAMHVPSGMASEDAERYVAGYVFGSGDDSQLIQAVKAFVPRTFDGEVVDAHAFSSWRQYGAVRIKNEKKDVVVLAGTPEVFSPCLSSGEEKKWLSQIIDKEAKQSKRVFCLVRADSETIPHDLSKTNLRMIAVFVLTNDLREGIQDAVNFFQDRGVYIKIISGDNTETIRAVATAANVRNPEALITSAEMTGWTQKDYDEHAKQYTIFARTVPEQKEMIIEALKKDGFTAMVGDGANDALAIKKSDLGIAMFDGAPATRSIAAVVLMRNSFTELPDGVRLADSIIENIQIFGAIFFNQTFIGFFLFAILTTFGFPFPFSPLNISFVNYFSVGFPGLLISYWAMIAEKKAVKKGSGTFLQRILPISFTSGVIEAVLVAGIFIYMLPRVGQEEAVTSVVLALIVFGFTFLLFMPKLYSAVVSREHKWGLAIFGLCEVVIALVAFTTPVVEQFFDLVTPTAAGAAVLIPVFVLYAAVQYALVVFFERKLR